MIYYSYREAPLQLYRKPLSSSTGKPLSSSPRRGEGWLACGKEAGGTPLQLYRKTPLQLSPSGRGLACLRKGGGRNPSPALQENPSPALPTGERAGLLAERRREEALSSSTGKPLSSSPHREEGWLACGKEAGGSPLQLYREAPLQLSPPGRGLACLRKGGGRKPSKSLFLPFYPFTFKCPSSSINGPLPGGERWRGAFFTFLPFYLFTFKSPFPNSFDT